MTRLVPPQIHESKPAGIQKRSESVCSRDSMKARRRIFKNAMSAPDVDEGNVQQRVLSLLESSNPSVIMAGFDLLQSCRSRGWAINPIEWELLKLHGGQSPTRENDDKVIVAAIARLSKDSFALTTILSRSHVSFCIGDFSFNGLTSCGKHVLKAISGRVDEVRDKAALAYIAAYTENAADRIAATCKLNPPAFGFKWNGLFF